MSSILNPESVILRPSFELLDQILHTALKLQLHDAIYRLRFHLNSLIRILSLSNSHNNVASIQKNRGDKSNRVIVALGNFSIVNIFEFVFCPWMRGWPQTALWAMNFYTVWEIQKVYVCPSCGSWIEITWQRNRVKAGISVQLILHFASEYPS